MVVLGLITISLCIRFLCLISLSHGEPVESVEVSPPAPPVPAVSPSPFKEVPPKGKDLPPALEAVPPKG